MDILKPVFFTAHWLTQAYLSDAAADLRSAQVLKET
jgi:hypothetical protein